MNQFFHSYPFIISFEFRLLRALIDPGAEQSDLFRRERFWRGSEAAAGTTTTTKPTRPFRRSVATRPRSRRISVWGPVASRAEAPLAWASRTATGTTTSAPAGSSLRGHGRFLINL